MTSKPLDVAALKTGLRTLHGRLTEDLVQRADLATVKPALEQAFEQAKANHRTGEDWALWRRHLAAQVASAWILSTLFVRVLEDRGFLPKRRLAGDGAAGREAREGRETLAELAPFVGDRRGSRDYLLLVFQELMTFDAVAPLFDPAHNLAWRLGPSDAGARDLIKFFEEADPADPERLRFGFDRERAPTTRFLGDVYEDLDPDAKKRFALLQTPDFVEKFLLDRTLEPAIATFGLGTPEDPIRLIDPTCGSGHFLLGAFERLVNRWSEAAPAAGPREWATRALRSVAGVDLNPYAVAIGRFRLVLAAFEAAGVTSLVGAPTFTPNVTCANALLGGRDADPPAEGEQLELGGGTWTGRALFEFEDPLEVRRILGLRYHVVVGNPPYIRSKDQILNGEYRKFYSACYRQYSLVVPFVQRFFELGVAGGFVGAIVANSFMKREFGVKLIEKFLPTVDVSSIYDIAGAYIPRHGTPTAILIGRHQPRRRDVVRVAMGKRGEPGRPKDPAAGRVWTSVANHGDELGFEDDYISVADVSGETLASHPWSLGGGGAAELKARLEAATTVRLSDRISAVGRTTVCGEDEAFLTSRRAAVRDGVPDVVVPLVIGKIVRDWSIHVQDENYVIYPYEAIGSSRVIPASHRVVERRLWRFRTLLARRTVFQKTLTERGQAWYEHLEHYTDKLQHPLSIAFAFVSTHNNFVVDRGGKLFKQTAPVIKLPADAGEDAHLDLVALLNSSTLGFWMRQVFNPKGMASDAHYCEAWQDRLEYDATKLKTAPIVDAVKARPFARALDALGREASEPLLDGLAGEALATSDRLSGEIATRVSRRRKTLARMRGLQEELDWLVYEIHGLCPAGAARVRRAEETPGLTLGHRPFEIALARKMAEDDQLETEWFKEHGSTQTAEIPKSLSNEDRDLVQKRLGLIETLPEIALIEQVEFKRRWLADDLDARVKAELRERLLDRIEASLAGTEMPVSVRTLAHGLERDVEVRALAQVFTDRLDVRLDDLVGKLLGKESVPAMGAYCYTETGIEKRAVWERVWSLQRQQDRGETVEIVLPEDFQYRSEDFQGDAWRHRKELDVPRERFISYPGCESSSDPTPLYGWGGWDRLRQAHAVLSLYERRRTEEQWPKERLVPLLAALQELMPWLLQWHNEPTEEGERPGETYASELERHLGLLSLSPADLRAWRPPKGRERRATGRVTKARVLANAGEDSTEETATNDTEVSAAAAAPPAEPPTPPSRRPRRQREALDPERVLAAIAERGGTATLKELAEKLNDSERAVRAAADALVAAGRLLKPRQRPITYATVAAQKAST